MRKPRCITHAITAFAILAAGAAAAGDTKPTGATVATVGGETITEQELSAAVANRLVRLRTEEYNIRRSALDEIVANRLLRQEAERRHVTVDEMLKSEIESKLTMPSATDLELFYDGVKDRFAGVPRDEAIRQIGEGMRRQQIAKKTTELVRGLRQSTRVKVLIEPPRIAVNAEGPSLGAANAPITVVEFSDFECPYCSRAAETLRKLHQTYGDKVRFVFRDFPLPIHRGAVKAAEAAHCAAEQGKFWEMHDKLYSKGGPQPESELRKAAADLGLNLDAFNACFGSGKFDALMKSSQEQASRAGVSSTPTFFVNGRMIVGAVPYEAFASIIDEELDRTAAPVAAGTH